MGHMMNPNMGQGQIPGMMGQGMMGQGQGMMGQGQGMMGQGQSMMGQGQGMATGMSPGPASGTVGNEVLHHATFE